MNPLPHSFIVILCAGLVISTGKKLVLGEEVQWRGQGRDGVIENFQVPKVWPKKLKQLWQVDVGEGYSSPVSEGERVFIHSRQGNEEWVHALNLLTGEKIWEAHYEAPASVHPAGASHGLGPKSTPAIGGGRLYTLGLGSILSCFDTKSGELYWRKEFSQQFEKPAPSCGTSMSPLLLDGLCIVHVGVDAKGEMIAFEAKSGARRWTYNGDGPGYGSAVIANLNGKRQLVAPVSKFIMGLSLEEGKPLWRHPFPTRSTQNIIMPTVFGERLIVGGIGQTTASIQLSGSDGALTIEEVWKNQKAPLHMSSPVLVGDRLIGLTSRKKGQLFCLNAHSGEMIWTSEGGLAQYATISIGDGHLIILTNKGKLIFMKADSETYSPLASYIVSDTRTWARPLVKAHRMIIKDDSKLTCWLLE